MCYYLPLPSLMLHDNLNKKIFRYFDSDELSSFHSWWLHDTLDYPQLGIQTDIESVGIPSLLLLYNCDSVTVYSYNIYIYMRVHIYIYL